MQRVIIDCDPGIDDAVALTVAFHWPKVVVEAVTCVAGNATYENVVRNAVSVVKLNGRNVPIYAGCPDTLLRRKHTVRPEDDSTFYHGPGGLGGVTTDLNDDDWKMLKQEHASIALCRLAKQNKKQLTLIATGPLTNVALAMRLDRHFTSNLKEMVIMGGNYLGPGSELGGAEFNFYYDSEAADIVLREARCPVTLVPFDTCETSCPIPWSWATEVTTQPGLPAHGRLVGDILKYYATTWPAFVPYDAITVVAALDKSTITSYDAVNNLAVNIDGDPLAGQGYGLMIHENSNPELKQQKHVPHGLPRRVIATSISMDEVKRRIAHSLH